ncbi:transposase family protein [Streptomyces sp. NPDC127051]|uniref:transposase family protein n=1 Tax=Streptomyces sp. NPDC127051 TaxID=3347119 RepID=UPI0036524C88
MPVSTIEVLSCRRARIADLPAAEPEELIHLAEVLQALPDPRRRQERRYRLGVLLALCTAAVLGGCATLVSIARFAVGAPPELRDRLGLGAAVPRACTLGRLLARIDTGALDWAAGTGLAGQLEPADGLRALAVDGKSLRGSRTAIRTAIHLLAAVAHGEKAVIAQRQVGSKSNEITAFQPLLSPASTRGHHRHVRRSADPNRSRPVPRRGEAGPLHRRGQGQPAHLAEGVDEVPLLDKARSAGHGREGSAGPRPPLSIFNSHTDRVTEGSHSCRSQTFRLTS